MNESDRGEGGVFTFVFTGGGCLHRGCGGGFLLCGSVFFAGCGASEGEDRAGRMKAG